jgi:hypothetical protein
VRSRGGKRHTYIRAERFILVGIKNKKQMAGGGGAYKII